MIEEFVWAEKYRPKTVEDCILPAQLNLVFRKMVETGDVDTMLLYGPAGTGKTTVARAVLEQIGCDYMVINGSSDGNIDTLRTRIMSFASSMSFSGSGKRKFVIIDEADGMSNAIQPALRNFMEEYSKNCGFIMTANYPNRIMKELKSRIAEIAFEIPEVEKNKLMAKFFKRVKAILDAEGVQYNEEAVGILITKRFPDMRKVLIDLQHFSKRGKIDAGILSQHSEEDFKELVGYLKKTDFTNMRKWVGEHQTWEFTDIMRRLYDTSYTMVKSSDIPQLVLILADNQKTFPFAIDKEIHIVGCLTEIMIDVSFV